MVYHVVVFCLLMIQSFANSGLEAFFFEELTPKGVGWNNVKKIVRRKLLAMDAAVSVADLKSPPGNKLEALKGSWSGYYSIRINDQWRVVFRWETKADGPTEVDVVDYH